MKRLLLVLLGLGLAAMATVVVGVAVLAGWEGPGTARLAQRANDLVMAQARPGGKPVVLLGHAVPVFELPGLHDGAARRLPERGRPMLITYWASWCGPCREEMPLLSNFARQQGPNGVQVVGIALDYPEEARAFLARRPTAFPNLVDDPDEGNSSERVGNLRGLLPFTVLVDAQGRLQHRKVGSFDTSRELTAWVAAAGIEPASPAAKPH